MKNRGILFSAPMVRAILDGTKTQTRRVVNVPRMEKIGPASSDTPEDFGFYAEGKRFSGWMVLARGIKSRGATNNDDASIPCPYGEPGDRLWVRETWACAEDRMYQQDKVNVIYRADEASCRTPPGGCWRPSLLMPRWASRITLEITDVRVERLHDISDADIRAEGVTAEAVRALVGRDYITEWVNEAFEEVVHIADMSPRDLWRVGWSAINGAESWAANPWLWCLTFRRVQP